MADTSKASRTNPKPLPHSKISVLVIKDPPATASQFSRLPLHK